VKSGEIHVIRGTVRYLHGQAGFGIRDEKKKKSSGFLCGLCVLCGEG